MGGEQRIDFALVILRGKFPRVGVHLIPAEDANAGLAHGGQKFLIPAAVLVGHKSLRFVLHGVEGFTEGRAVGRSFVVAVFNALQNAGNANLEELVEIAGGDGEKLDPLEERVGGIFGFFQNPAIKTQPGFVAAEEKALRALWFFPHRGGRHPRVVRGSLPDWLYHPRSPEKMNDLQKAVHSARSAGIREPFIRTREAPEFPGPRSGKSRERDPGGRS
jgi:hypothetical protein